MVLEERSQAGPRAQNNSDEYLFGHLLYARHDGEGGPRWGPIASNLKALLPIGEQYIGSIGETNSYRL